MSSREDSGVSYNRVFVLGAKTATKDDFKESFGKYGEIKDIWMVEDRKTGEFKGVTYITFSKASEAALAIEELNGHTIGTSPKPLKVILANDKREGNVRDPNEGERMQRLFIMVPKDMTEEEIKEKFEEYGQVEFVRLLKDRRSGESRGLAFVKFYRAYHCALALEQCDPGFKAVFAAPRESSSSRHDKWDDYSDSYSGSRDYTHGSHSSLTSYSDTSTNRTPLLISPAAPNPLADLLRSYSTTGQTTLEVMAAPGVTRDQLYTLLDMTPGLEYCEVDRDSGVAYVQYKLPQLAAYAKDKLSFLEYPPGYRIAVRYQEAYTPYRSQTTGNSNVEQVATTLNASLQGLESGNIQNNLGTLVESIKKATEILQKAGIQGGIAPLGCSSSEERVRFCNVPLPLTKPFAHRDSAVAERLFLVSQPDPFSTKYLHDVFCRFGDLIDAYFVPGKNYGYAKFASHDAAEEAMRVLHGQTVCGMRLKVMKADPPKHDEDKDDMVSKRARLS
ncbi:hypothetical protein LSH36_1005g00011 [Paralvinella palmiformis]|uniref:RRM domain-containing protein n=1 Tax=Paralvinella palmiformis TaxID=53620 RepID=A0AAD9MT39_9ANNE|nr:hypothetical protein LSH36_1005g00011 [Paralvinella palmiformis]